MPGNRPNRLRRMDAILADPAGRTPERLAKRQALADMAAAASLLANVHVAFVGPIYDVQAVAADYGINPDALTVALDDLVDRRVIAYIDDPRYARYAYPEKSYDRRPRPAPERAPAHLELAL